VGIAWTCAALLTLAVAARVVAKATLSADLAEVVDVSVLRRGWEFGLGMWVAERLAREGRPWRGARVAWLGLGGVTLAAGLGLAFLPGGLRVRAFAWPLLFAVAVEWAARAGGPASLLERLARWVGERSYSLYLVHPVGLALGMWVYAGWQDGRAAGAAVMLCCTGLLFVGGGAPVRGPGATGASSARARQPGGVKRSPRPVLRRGMHAPRQPDGQGPGEWASPTARQRPGSAGRPGAL
jgi:peptidoglycan/LPS O-acetylase OafA/YrhL